MSIAASVGVLFTAVLQPSAAPGEAAPTVRWEAPAECGSASELRERITQQLGAVEASIEILGRVEREEGIYALELELVVGEERQRRSFSAQDCRTLLDAAVLVSSAALGPDREEPKLVEPEAERPEPEVAQSEPEVAQSDLEVERPELAEPVEPEPAPPRRTHGHWLASARAGVGYDGTVARPGGSLGASYQWRRWRLQVHIDAFGSRARRANGDLDLAVVTLDPRACGIVRPASRVELLPCGGVAVGPAIGHGRDVRNGRRAIVPWAAAHADLDLLVTVRPRLALGFELSAYGMLTRPRFTLSDGQTVYRAGPAGGRGLFVIELRFSSATD